MKKLNVLLVAALLGVLSTASWAGPFDNLFSSGKNRFPQTVDTSLLESQNQSAPIEKQNAQYRKEALRQETLPTKYSDENSFLFIYNDCNEYAPKSVAQIKIPTLLFVKKSRVPEVEFEAPFYTNLNRRVSEETAQKIKELIAKSPIPNAEVSIFAETMQIDALSTTYDDKTQTDKKHFTNPVLLMQYRRFAEKDAQNWGKWLLGTPLQKSVLEMNEEFAQCVHENGNLLPASAVFYPKEQFVVVYNLD